MNYSYQQPLPVGQQSSFSMSSIGSVFGRFWAVITLILIIFVILVIYYKTVGYYIDFGWKRIYEIIRGKETVKIDVGEDTGITGTFKPMDEPNESSEEGSSATNHDEPPRPRLPPADERTPGLPGAIDSVSSSLFGSLNIGGPGKEVFNVSRNIYTYDDASAVCSAYGAELATYEQMKEAFEKGADWCNYGWVKGQMALYPTQKETYEKLQKGAPEFRNACGSIGVNGGYFDNPELRFGVNCFGKKPAKNASDELNESSVQLPPSPAEIEYEKKVQKFREQMNTMTVLPFRRGQWTE